MLKEYLEIGKIVGTHGINGELRVEPWCDSPQFLCQFKTLYKGSDKQQISVKSRPHKNIVLMKIAGIDTVQQGDAMRGTVLYMNRNDANLPQGVFFIEDIIGLQVTDQNTGKIYGNVTDVLKTGANDVYQVTDSDGNDYLVPKIDDVVKEVAPNEGYIKIFPIKGIFENED